MTNFEESIRFLKERTGLKNQGKVKVPDGGKKTIRYMLTDSGRNYEVRAVFKDRLFLIFEMHPGIHAGRVEFLPNLSLYGQTNAPKTGSLRVNPWHSNVYIHMETSILDKPLDEECLKSMEAAGLEYFREHYDNLKKLAGGRFIIEALRKGAENKQDIYSETYKDSLFRDIAGIVDHNLEESDINFLAVYGDIVCEETGFSYIRDYKGQPFRFEYSIDNAGFLRISASPGNGALIIKEPYMISEATFIDAMNSDGIYGSLDIGYGGRGINAFTQTFYDGGVSMTTLAIMENRAAYILNKNLYNLEMIGEGMPLSSDNKEDIGVEKDIERILKAGIENRTNNLNKKHPIFGES